MPTKVSAGAVIFRQDDTRQYLLLERARRKSGYWDFPRGNVEKNETPWLTARREIREETGIEDIRFIPGFSEKICYYYKTDRSTIMREVLFLLAETETEKVVLSYEHTGFEWLDYRRAYERITHRSSKSVLEKAERLLSTLKNYDLAPCDSILSQLDPHRDTGSI